jgi:hypothetical protein
MSQLPKNYISADAGSVELISFKKFISLLSVVKTEKEIHHFNTLLGYEENSSPNYCLEGVDNISNYKRLAVYPNGIDKVKSSLATLVLQAQSMYIFKESPQELLEKATLDYVMDFGEPQYAVRVGTRTWMIANLEDFQLIENNNGHALACLVQCRTKLIDVLKQTQEEVLGLVQKQL